MDGKFAKLVEPLARKFEVLMEMDPVIYESLPRGALGGVPKRGIYLFSRGSEHLYVGRSNNIRKRLGLHCRPKSRHNQATFAFRIAREKTGRLRASYTTKESREELLHDEAFWEAFDQAKRDIRLMDFRYVEESDATRQALLEIYAATVLETPYNDFDNH